MKIRHGIYGSLICALISSASLSVAASVTLNFEGGLLYGADTSAPLADGALVYAVAVSPGASLSGPIDGAFVSAADVFLGQWGVNSAVAGLGSFSESLSNLEIAGDLSAGMGVWLVWFPDLQVSGGSPSLGLSYGVYHGSSWLIPESGTAGFYLETEAIGGSLADAGFVANRVVSAVPEPSAFAVLAGLGALGFTTLRRRR